MKIWVVAGKMTVYGAYTNREDAIKKMEYLDDFDRFCGGWGNKAIVKEIEIDANKIIEKEAV